MTRGEIWLIDFGIPFGSEAGFERPALIIQDDNFNKSKISTIVVVPFTTNISLEEAPGNVFIQKSESGLTKDSVIVVSLIASIDKKRLVRKLSKLNDDYLVEVVEGIKLLLGM